VTDFGIARAVNTEESLTQTGAVMGTATYFSPEQAEGMGVDSRSDIYSLRRRDLRDGHGPPPVPSATRRWRWHQARARAPARAARDQPRVPPDSKRSS